MLELVVSGVAVTVTVAVIVGSGLIEGKLPQHTNNIRGKKVSYRLAL